MDDVTFGRNGNTVKRGVTTMHERRCDTGTESVMSMNACCFVFLNLGLCLILSRQSVLLQCFCVYKLYLFNTVKLVKCLLCAHNNSYLLTYLLAKVR